MLGIDYMQVNRYERGINLPSVETAVKLARLLQITTDELLTGSETTPTPPPIRNIKLVERLQLLDQLPRGEQEVALQILDGVIAKYELGRLAGKLQPAAPATERAAR